MPNRQVAAALYRNNVLTIRYGGDKGVLTEGAEVARESFKVVITHGLFGEGQHVVFEPGGSDLCNRGFCQCPGEVYIGDVGAANLPTGFNNDTHGFA